MTAILIVAAAAAAAFTAHMVYGFMLVGREYDRSEQAWTNARERIVPIRPTQGRLVRQPQFQRA